MIVVTVGSNGSAFDRLLRELEGIGGDEEMLVQHGPSQIRPRRATCVPFLRFGELDEAVRSARLVITHAGVGSVLLALMNGKRPIVVPRERRFGEVVDDHQVSFAERLARDELVTLVREPNQLAAAVASADGGAIPAARRGGSALEAELAEYLRQTLDGGSKRS